MTRPSIRLDPPTPRADREPHVRRADSRLATSCLAALGAPCVFAVASAVGCSAPSAAPQPSPAPQPPAAFAGPADAGAEHTGPERVVLRIEGSEINGLSGLTRAPDGALWSVAERDRFLVRIPDARGIGQTVPIRGVPDEVELESVAWLDARHIALGSEGGPHDHDTLFVVEATGPGDRAAGDQAAGDKAVAFAGAGGWTVASTVSMPYDLWSMTGDRERGIEGLCATETHIVAVVEQFIRDGARRYAPVGRYDRAAGTWTGFRLELTTDTGKIAGITCRADASGTESIDIIAIERHFAVSRLIAARLPTVGPGGDIQARLVVDLTDHTEGGTRNFEGIAPLGDRLAVIVDNHYGHVTGPNEMLLVALPHR